MALVVAGIGLAGVAVNLVWLSLTTGWLGMADRLGVQSNELTGFGITVVMLVLIAVGGLLFVGGLGFYVLAPGFGSGVTIWRGVGTHQLVIAMTVLVVLVANVGPLLYIVLTGSADLKSLPGLLSAALSADVALLGMTYFRFLRPGVLTVAELGFSLTALPRQIGMGLVLGFLMLVVSAAIQLVMKALGYPQTQLAELEFVRAMPPASFLAVTLAGAVLAPISEELYFRGAVFRGYLRTSPPWVAYLATGVLFALLHLNWRAFLPLFVLSLMLCWTYRRTGSIVPSMVGHMVNNTTAFCILYLTSSPL